MPPHALSEPQIQHFADYSPVERCVLRALGVDRLDYHIEGERRRFDVKAYREAQARKS